MALRNIIVVDDEQYMRERTAKCINNSHYGISYKVETASNGHEGFMLALEIIRRKEIVSLVVSDIEMPISDGLELIQVFKASDIVRHIPILMVSSVNDKTKVLEAIKLGAKNYLLKPWENEDLLHKMSLCF